MGLPKQRDFISALQDSTLFGVEEKNPLDRFLIPVSSRFNAFWSPREESARSITQSSVSDSDSKCQKESDYCKEVEDFTEFLSPATHPKPQEQNVGSFPISKSLT
ncbi:uncharacterized protein LOC111443077 [Cucurbita moschata]|uniref:Uncharacterized protein LOC111443077 n=1 Tax=Cucurbita moschata TaxID=3662 RepID=A0A6J1F8D6_CUCMO|nr:uncharacterized protein LOC111443077 [Cucurbita moschata]